MDADATLSHTPVRTESRADQRERLSESSRLRQAQVIGGVLLFFALLFLLLLALSMGRELNHDEHQFVASAVQIAREQQLPYADFAYFHVPLLSFIYALLFQATDRLLLGARLFSVCFAWLTLWLVFIAIYRSHVAERLRMRLLVAGLFTLWLMALPLFTYAGGLAWNHDLPIFLMLLAFLVQSDLMVERRSAHWLGVSGLLLGLAVTVRLSFAFAAIPFVLVLWLYPVYAGRQRWIGLGAFGMGALLAGIPTIYLFARDPAAFFFGNVTYVRLNTLYHAAVGVRRGMTIDEKFFRFMRMFITQPGNLLLPAALLESVWPLRRSLMQRLPFVRSRPPAADKRASLFRVSFLLLILLFVTVSGFVATPFQPQYFYVMAPLMVLCVGYALSAWPASAKLEGRFVFIGAVGITLVLAIPAYAPGLAILFQPQQWEPNKIHGYGQEIAAHVEIGPVLTLAPIYPLEGQVTIPAEFVTGPFAWRVAPLISPAERMRYGVIGPEDLDAQWAHNLPPAILVGVEKDDAEDEVALIDFAQAHGYREVSLRDGSSLWLRAGE